VNDRQSGAEASKTNSDDQLQLGEVDKLPPVDTAEASSVSATRYCMQHIIIIIIQSSRQVPVDWSSG